MYLYLISGFDSAAFLHCGLEQIIVFLEPETENADIAQLR